MLTVFLRTIFIYVFLLVVMRVMGKRQVGELQLQELIVTFMLSELAVSPIANPATPLLYAIIPILTLLSIELILSFWMTHSNRMKRLLSGTPALVICKGKLDQKVMADNRLEIEELLAELRQNGVATPSEVQYAVLEENGKLSVFPKAGYGAATWQDMQNGASETGIAHAVVVDGEIRWTALSLAGRDEGWLMAYLRKKKLPLSQVFLMTVDDGGEVYLVRREVSGDNVRL